MLIFPLIGVLLWIAFLSAVFVICGALWLVASSVSGILDLAARHKKRKRPVGRPAPRTVPRAAAPAPPRRTPATTPPPVPARRTPPADPRTLTDIWPKWTPSHRLYKNYELALWQEQFDALVARE
jgi:hypothetical protein